MRSINYTALIITILVSGAYGAWLSYEQWHWYLGWPGPTWAQGALEFGWPTTHLTRLSSLGSPDVYWKWSTRNLCINSGLVLVLSLAVSASAYRIACAIRTNGYSRFALGTLFTLTTAVGAVFPLWQIIRWISTVGEQRWNFLVCEDEIPWTLHAVVDVGLFFFAWGVISLTVVALGALVRLVRQRGGSSLIAKSLTTRMPAG